VVGFIVGPLAEIDWKGQESKLLWQGVNKRFGRWQNVNMGGWESRLQVKGLDRRTIKATVLALKALTFQFFFYAYRHSLADCRPFSLLIYDLPDGYSES
jgi:hypothetical protein